MSESPGGAFIDQFKNWSIPLSDFPVSHKGKSDASESLYGGFVARQSRDISLRRPKGLASRRSGGRIPYGVPKSGIPEWVSRFLIFVRGIRTGAGVNDVPGARQSRDPASAALKD